MSTVGDQAEAARLLVASYLLRPTWAQQLGHSKPASLGDGIDVTGSPVAVAVVDLITATDGLRHGWIEVAAPAAGQVVSVGLTVDGNALSASYTVSGGDTAADVTQSLATALEAAAVAAGLSAGFAEAVEAAEVERFGEGADVTVAYAVALIGNFVLTALSVSSGAGTVGAYADGGAADLFTWVLPPQGEGDARAEAVRWRPYGDPLPFDSPGLHLPIALTGAARLYVAVSLSGPEGVTEPETTLRARVIIGSGGA